MLLSKEIAVYLNLAACKLKQYSSTMMRQSNLGLTPEQFLLIDLLWNEGPMSQQMIADMMQKDKNSVTKLLDALERKELVVRCKNPNDRRSNTIVLTPKGEDMKAAAKETGISMLDNAMIGISEKELKGFLATLKKLTDTMSSIS